MTAQRRQLGAGPHAKRVVADGVSLALRDEGRGPALVCLHSIAHGSRDFAGLAEALRDGFRVVSLDWPGHGDSDADTGPVDAQRFGELLAQVLDGLGIERAVLLGNSIGGAAALHVASRMPERVRGLVLIDAGGLVPIGVLARVFCRVMAAFFAAGARGAWWFPRAFAWYYGLILPEPPARAQRERIIAAGSEMARSLELAWRSFGRPDADLRMQAAQLRCPALVCWSERDRVIPLALARPAIERIPGARLALFPGGHSPFLECPERFMPELTRFLDQLGQ